MESERVFFVALVMVEVVFNTMNLELHGAVETFPQVRLPAPPPSRDFVFHNCKNCGGL